MRIVIINDFCSRNGGTAAVAIDSAIGLANAGCEVRFFGMTGPVDPVLAATKGVTVYCDNEPTFLDNPSRVQAAVSGLWSLDSKRALRKFINDWIGSEVIIHVHGWVKALSASIFTELNNKHWRVVVTLHDYFLACPNGGFLDYQKTAICTRTALSGECLFCNCDSRSYAQKLWRFGRGLIQSYGVNIPSRIHGIIGVSHFSLNKLRSYLPEGLPISVIRNPVAVKKPEVLGGNFDGPLLYVGRLSSEKGVPLALSAARSFRRKITIIGGGPLKQQLMNDYPEADFRGWLPPEDVYTIMQSASALVFPSLWYETNGLVVLEAMAHGLPVIVSNACASTEFVVDGVNGRHFEQGSCTSLVEVLNEVFTSQSHTSLGKSAYDWYWSNPWSQKTHVSELLSFYNKL